MSAHLFGARVLDDARHGPGNAPAKPATESYLASPRSALGSLIVHDWKSCFVLEITMCMSKIIIALSENMICVSEVMIWVPENMIARMPHELYV